MFDVGGYLVRVFFAPSGTPASPPQRTESLARELMRGLLGEGAAPTLAIESGPSAGSKRTLLPPDSKLVIGRGDDADWVIVDEDLSRKHAELRRSWDGTTLRDLESQNGTRVDGTKIDEVALRDGARIELGGVVMVFSDPAERHLAPKTAAAKSIAAPSARPSALPFVVAAALAGFALVALAYVLAS